MQTAAPFPRHIAVLILATLACSFAANHIAARIAFDHGTGLLLAMLCRAGVTLLALAALVFWRRESLRLSPATWRWQILLGLLIALLAFLGVAWHSLTVYADVQNQRKTWKDLGAVVGIGALLVVIIIWFLTKAAAIL